MNRPVETGVLQTGSLKKNRAVLDPIRETTSCRSKKGGEIGRKSSTCQKTAVIQKARRRGNKVFIEL